MKKELDAILCEYKDQTINFTDKEFKFISTLPVQVKVLGSNKVLEILGELKAKYT